MFERKLIDYLPPNERNFEEFQAILTTAEQPEFSDTWEAIDNALDDQFIVDATENGVSRLEKVMGIVPKATDTLDARKFTLLTRIGEQVPFTIIALERQLETLCGEGNYEVIRDVATKNLHVQIALVAKSNFNDVEKLLERIVPADMTISVSLKYTQNSLLSNYTHAELKSFTHYELRNEVVLNGK